MCVIACLISRWLINWFWIIFVCLYVIGLLFSFWLQSFLLRIIFSLYFFTLALCNYVSLNRFKHDVGIFKRKGRLHLLKFVILVLGLNMLVNQNQKNLFLVILDYSFLNIKFSIRFRCKSCLLFIAFLIGLIVLLRLFLKNGIKNTDGLLFYYLLDQHWIFWVLSMQWKVNYWGMRFRD